MEHELQALIAKFADRTLPIGSVYKVGKILGIRGSFHEQERAVRERLLLLSEDEKFSNEKLLRALQNAEKR